MKKRVGLVLLSLIVISILGVASAQILPAGANTIISGTIYNADFTQTIAGASVTVTCNGRSLETTSLSDGTYSVEYSGQECSQGNDLGVNALKDGVGENTIEGVITNQIPNPDWNLGLIDVPLVPEFGTMVGVLTVLGALGTFFVVRRN